MKTKMLKTEAEAKSFSINLWQSKNTKVFVPIRIYTDPLTKVLLIMQFASRPSSWLGASPIWHDHGRCAPSDMIFSKKAPSLSPDHWSARISAGLPLPTRGFGTGPTVASAPPTPTPVSIRSRQQKPNWPRKVNAHSTSLHSFPNRIQCKKTAKAASRDCVYWPLWQRSRRPTCTGARRAHCPGARPRQWSEGDVPLIQLVRKVILCFQYETFHTVKSNPKTSWIQSSHTFKRNFNWCWIEFRLRQDVTSKLCGRHRRFQLRKKERDVRRNFFTRLENQDYVEHS